MSPGLIDLDANATTRPCVEAIDAMHEAATRCWGNPSSMHRLGQAARATVDRARTSVAMLLGAHPREVVFTASGSEALHLGLHSMVRAGARVLTSPLEHPCVGYAIEACACRRIDCRVDAGGRIDIDDLLSRLREADACVVHSVNHETGVIQDLTPICAEARARGVPVLVDAVQHAGKMALDVRALGADAVAISGHKFHGPKGVGALFVDPSIPVRPVLGGPQERGARGGTEAVEAIAGAGAAAQAALAWLGKPEEVQRLRVMRDDLERAVVEAWADARVHGEGAPRIWNTTCVALDGTDGEALQMALSERGVCVGRGSACSSGSGEPSPILLAMGQSEESARSSLRLSISRMTTPEEIARAREVLSKLLRAMGG